MREYVFHNINNGNVLNKPANPAVENRQVSQTPDTINLKQGIVRVETTDIDNEN